MSVTGHSGGGYAAARALLVHPEFYRVGMALAGSHDPGTYLSMWAEHYHGDLSDKGKMAMSNPAVAAERTGKLLLIHGELDDNVLPAQALRLVDALITRRRRC